VQGVQSKPGGRERRAVSGRQAVGGGRTKMFVTLLAQYEPKRIMSPTKLSVTHKNVEELVVKVQYG
jgi:hypothetical protein